MNGRSRAACAKDVKLRSKLPFSGSLSRFRFRVLPGGLLAPLLLVNAALAAEPVTTAVAAFPPVPEEPPAAPVAPAAPAPAAAAFAPAPAAVTSLPVVAPWPPPASPKQAPPQRSALGPQLPPEYAAAPAGAQGDVLRDRDRDREKEDEEFSKQWMLSLEGVTHAPIDLGFQAGVEFPVGLRASVGYGWVPAAYVNFLTQAAALSVSSNPAAAALLSEGFQGGHTWRLQAGIRPFKDIGLYLEGGYVHLKLDGRVEASSVTGLPVSGDYEATSSIGMWNLELGYQGWIGSHVVLAAGLGVTRATSATTELSGPGLDPALTAEATGTVDRQIEDNGVLPTLTLRFGFDLI